MARLLCTIPFTEEETTVISGIRFSRLSDGRLLSESVEEDDEFRRHLSIPGYLVAAGIDDDEVTAVDARIAQAKAASAEAAAPGLGPEGVQLQVELAEQRANNHALAADLNAARERIAALERQLQGTEVPRLTAENERLKRQVDEAGGTPMALENEVATLRRANEQLGEEVTRLRTKGGPLRAENDQLRARIAELEKAAGGGTGAQA